MLPLVSLLAPCLSGSASRSVSGDPGAECEKPSYTRSRQEHRRRTAVIVVCDLTRSHSSFAADVELEQEACEGLYPTGTAPSDWLVSWDPFSNPDFDPTELDCHGKSFTVDSLIGASGCWKSTCELSAEVLTFFESAKGFVADPALYLELILGGLSCELPASSALRWRLPAQPADESLLRRRSWPLTLRCQCAVIVCGVMTCCVFSWYVHRAQIEKLQMMSRLGCPALDSSITSTATTLQLRKGSRAASEHFL